MTLPATTLESALEVPNVGDEYDWLSANPCLCGGKWALRRQALLDERRTEAGLLMTDQLHVECNSCGRERDFYFVVNYGDDL